MKKVKDRTGIKHDRLTALSFDKIENGHTYWKFQCSCGNTVSRVFENVAKNKYNACLECLKGPGSWAWKGVGEFPQSHYRTIYHGAKDRNLEFAVSAQYLWDLFLKQDRKCVFTGWSLDFVKSYEDKETRTASLDRIDSSIGYVEGNLQWVHRDVNKLKKNMSDSKFIELCIAVAANTTS